MGIVNQPKYNSSDRPHVPVGSHPIEHGDYLLDTISINDLIDSVSNWILLRNTGAIIYGPPRLGKTRAIKFLIRYFENKYKDQWCSYFVLSKKYKAINEDRFFSNLLKDVGHSAFSVGKADVKRNRLINFLIEHGQNTVRNQIVFFIDDAQRYSDLEYEWLMDIYNELDSYGITVTTILVGQTELSHRRSVYLLSHKQIVGRFMVHDKRFYGLRGVDELAYLLESYDTVTEYPEMSKWSYSRFFFPIGFENGRRLEKDASDIWKIIIELRAKAGITNLIEIPMHYIISIINYVLLRYGANEEGLDWPTLNIWKEAIVETGYLHSEMIYSGMKG